jgi:hypothetical protein
VIVQKMVGERFGRLVVLDQFMRDEGRVLRVLCRCDCGSEKYILPSNLRSGNAKSCGCLARQVAGDAARTHGMRNTRTYRIWNGMMSRCHNPAATGYSRYGGRGIKVCERWMEFENFLADMGEAPTAMTLDRRDNNGPYSPENCRWATRREQNNNSSGNRVVEAFGRAQTVAQWAREVGIKYQTLYRRLTFCGWPAERALSERP